MLGFQDSPTEEVVNSEVRVCSLSCGYIYTFVCGGSTE